MATNQSIRDKILSSKGISGPQIVQTPQGPALQINLGIAIPFEKIFQGLAIEHLRIIQSKLEEEIRKRGSPI